ncbi:MAG: hypothetical protein KDC24_03775 [Saprospiraceae bacterium]|nr:hypothetical protein [Saprospiraceae bacterium]
MKSLKAIIGSLYTAIVLAGLFTMLVGSGACNDKYDCPDLKANVGDVCTNASGQSSVIDENCICKENESEILVDTRDGQTYPTVVIGGKRWMAKNLNIGTMIASDYVDPMNFNNCPGDLNPTNPTNNLILEKYCYDNNPANCDLYGGLYAWDEMMGYTTTPGAQGICPDGWHIPTDQEWKDLEVALGMTAYAAGQTGYRGTNEGDKLKTAGNCTTPGDIICGSADFNALIAGARFYDGTFGTINDIGWFWSSSEATGFSDCGVWDRDVSRNGAKISRSWYGKADAFSCRCVED